MNQWTKWRKVGPIWLRLWFPRHLPGRPRASHTADHPGDET